MCTTVLVGSPKGKLSGIFPIMDGSIRATKTFKLCPKCNYFVVVVSQNHESHRYLSFKMISDKEYTASYMHICLIICIYVHIYACVYYTYIYAFMRHVHMEALII